MEERKMMSLEVFAEEVKLAIREKILDESEVTIGKITKNNGCILTGITVRHPGQELAPTVYLDGYHKQYQVGRCLDQIVEDVWKAIERPALEGILRIDELTDWEKAKEWICFKLVNARLNEKLLSDVPHIRWLDLAIVFYYKVDCNLKVGQAGILVKGSLMQRWGIGKEELYEQAKKNTPVLNPARIGHIFEVLPELFKEQLMSGTEQIDEESEFGLPMYVLTNSGTSNGASCVLYPNVIRDFAEEKDADFFILPSSVDELILVPDDGTIDPENLREMVTEINESVVAAEDKLADSVYYYKRETNEVELVAA